MDSRERAQTIIFILLSIGCGVLVGVNGYFLCAGDGFGVNYATVDIATGRNNFLFQRFMWGLFQVFFGVLIVVFEIFWPPRMLQFFGFYQRWVGKGLFFIFLGLWVFRPGNSGAYAFWAGIVVMVVGAVYLILGFVPGGGSPRTAYNVYSPSAPSSSPSSTSKPAKQQKPVNKSDTHCSKCGHKKETKNDAFCGSCGARL